jgi:hypothetical protein
MDEKTYQKLYHREYRKRDYVKLKQVEYRNPGIKRMILWDIINNPRKYLEESD